MARPKKSVIPTQTSEVELGVSKNNEDSILRDVTYAGVNAWTSFNNWIGDMDLSSPIPEILLESPAINNLTLLYHFVQFPLVFIYINNTFNNYNLLLLDKASVLKMLKEIIYYTRFRSKYMKTEKKVEDDKLIGIIYDKFGEDTKIVRTGETTVAASVKVQISPTFFGWLFQFGKQMKVLSPANPFLLKRRWATPPTSVFLRAKSNWRLPASVTTSDYEHLFTHSCRRDTLLQDCRGRELLCLPRHQPSAERSHTGYPKA